MKNRNKIIMAAMLLGTSLAVSVQRKVGSFTIQPKVGMTVSSMTNNPEMTAAVVSTQKTPEEYGELGDYGDLQFLVASNTGIKEKIDIR